MICITGDEPDVDSLAERLAAHPEALHEVRLDALTHDHATLEPALDLVSRHAQWLVVTCRPRRHRGGYDGDERERIAALARAQRLGARWVDVESEVDTSSFDPSRLLLSEHHYAPITDAADRLRGMRPRARLIKLAVTVEDAAELIGLQAARREIEGEAIVIGMGAAGLLSRARHRQFGSAFTYVAVSADRSTAAGQLDLKTFRHQGLDEEAPFCVLAGGPGVMASPGPKIYPPLFRRRSLAARSYLPVITTSLAQTLPWLGELGAVGVSVTMPLKAEAAQISAPDVLVTRLGVANSLRPRGEGWQASNSDVAGIRGPLLARVERGQRALVLGAGGAAAAAIEALDRLGLVVSVSARSFDRARELAARFEGVTAVSWPTRDATRPDVVVNATPIAGAESPWPDGSFLDAVVLDCAFGPRNRLRRQSRHYLDAMAMWVAQGAQQIGWFFDVDIAPTELRP